MKKRIMGVVVGVALLTSLVFSVVFGADIASLIRVATNPGSPTAGETRASPVGDYPTPDERR